MNKHLILLFTVFCPLLVYSQTNKLNIHKYVSEIDTNNRKVYIIVDKMPELIKEPFYLHKKLATINFDTLKNRPSNVYFAFIVEIDGTLSNIKIHPEFQFCNEIEILESERQYIVQQFTQLLSSIKTTTGTLNNQPVAVAFISKIHYDYQ